MAILNSLYNNKRDSVYCNINQICYMLTGSFENKRSIVDGVRKGINSLIESDTILVLSSNKSDFLIGSKNIYIEDNYVVAYEREVNTVFNLSTKHNCFQICRYLLNVISTINNDKKYWFAKIEDLCCMSFIAEQTLITYNTILEKSEILYIHRYKECVKDLDTSLIRRISNTYGRYEDKEKVIIGATEYFNTILGVCGHNKKYENVSGRSIKAKYNHYISGLEKGKVYDYEYIIALTEECILYNEKYKNIPDVALIDLATIA